MSVGVIVIVIETVTVIGKRVVVETMIETESARGETGPSHQRTVSNPAVDLVG
jgi:hypothetical protein